MKNKTIMIVVAAGSLVLPLQGLSKIEYVSLAAIAGLTSWGFIERYRKNDYAARAAGLEKRAAGLQEEVSLYKSDAHELAKDQEFLSQISTSLECINKRYAFVAQETLDEKYHQALREHLLKGGSVPLFEQQLKDDRALVLSNRHALDIKISHWRKKQSTLLEKAVTYLEDYKSADAVLTALALALHEYRDFCDLGVIMERLDKNISLDERNLVELINTPNFADELQRLIQKHYNESFYRFPYVTYAHKIKSAKEELEAVVSKLNGFENFQGNKAVRECNELTRAKIAIEWLDRLYTSIVTSPIHEQQRIQKPEFDRQEEERKRKFAKKESRLKAELQEKEARLKAELQEKEARANAVKDNAERLLVEERRRAQEAANRRAQIECEERQSALKRIELEHSQEQMRQREHITSAVRENNRTWQEKYDSLKNTAEQLKNTAEQKKNAAEYESTNLRRRIVSSKSELGQIQDALNVGIHVGPEHQAGVNSFLNLIRRHVAAARTALN